MEKSYQPLRVLDSQEGLRHPLRYGKNTTKACRDADQNTNPRKGEILLVCEKVDGERGTAGAFHRQPNQGNAPACRAREIGNR